MGKSSSPPPFSTGDVVKLKCGSSPMVVVGTAPTGLWVCAWHCNNGTAQEGRYHPECLEKSPPKF